MKRWLITIGVIIASSDAVISNVNPLAIITGYVIDEQGKPVIGASVGLKDTPHQTLSRADGSYKLEQIPFGSFTIVAFYTGKRIIQQPIVVDDQWVELKFILNDLNELMAEVVVRGQSDRVETGHLNAIENFGIYEGRKTEVVAFRNLTVNTATNNARQIFSKVTGLNIWESDGAGLQLGVGGRGLSPNRTSNFNVRQNGYDISADALGYPESYYTPPAEALEEIEVVRGAASLQYGTQFGGLLNFKFRKGPSDKRVELTSRQSVGSWGFFGTFNSIGGTVAKGRLNYYAYYNYKTGNGYRANSGFDFHNAYASVNYQINPALLLNVDVTKMSYLAQQPGGLTDVLFEQDPRASLRERNWFKVDWNLFSVNLTYKFSHLTELNIRNFGLIASRNALGVLTKTNVADLGGNRDLISGDFRNMGSETRLLHRYELFGNQHAFVTGFRIYHGTTTAQQGWASDSRDADFRFLNPEDVEKVNYTYPNRNYAFFAENIFDICDRFSITPGIRVENIRTYADGYYKTPVYDMAGNLVAEERTDENLERVRSFVLGGIGLSYKASEKIEFYGNLSMNYRGINFSDLRIVNPSSAPSLDIRDEKGFTADLGTRGSFGNFLRYEVTAFYLNYDGKIGTRFGYNDRGMEYRIRDNISDARNVGLEAFGEVNLTRALAYEGASALSVFVNTAYIDARYVRSEDASVRNKKVEMVPPLMIRSGATYRYKGFSVSPQFSYVSRHFSDATNAERTASALEGVIPTYYIVDLSASYDWRSFRVEMNCNNLLDQQYFTRRAESYPGPGIIPAEGRGFFVTLQAKVGK